MKGFGFIDRLTHVRVYGGAACRRRRNSSSNFTADRQTAGKQTKGQHIKHSRVGGQTM